MGADAVDHQDFDRFARMQVAFRSRHPVTGNDAAAGLFNTPAFVQQLGGNAAADGLTAGKQKAQQQHKNDFRHFKYSKFANYKL